MIVRRGAESGRDGWKTWNGIGRDLGRDRREGRRDGRRTWTGRRKATAARGSARFASRTRDGRAGSSAQGRSASTAAAGKGAAAGARPSAGGSLRAARRGAAAHRQRREDAAARVEDSAIEHVGERASPRNEDAGARVAWEWRPPRRRVRSKDVARAREISHLWQPPKASSLECVTFVFVCVSVTCTSYWFDSPQNTSPVRMHRRRRRAATKNCSSQMRPFPSHPTSPRALESVSPPS